MSKIKNILKRIGLSERDAEDLINEIRGSGNGNGSNDNITNVNTLMPIVLYADNFTMNSQGMIQYNKIKNSKNEIINLSDFYISNTNDNKLIKPFIFILNGYTYYPNITNDSNTFTNLILVKADNSIGTLNVSDTYFYE